MNISQHGKRIIFFIVTFLLLIIVVISVLVLMQSNNKSTPQVQITNLDSCSENMKVSLEDLMNTTVYRYIEAANNHNNEETARDYSAEIREGSCQEDTIQTKGTNGSFDIKETTVILDIPDAKQSWEMIYHWQTENEERGTDLGTVATLNCLPIEKLKYGDFNCDSVVSLMKYGTAKSDPILQYMPYTGAGFNLTYNPDTREVAAEITLRGSQMNNEELKANLRTQVEYWFTKRNLDMTTYTVTYSYTNLDETGNTLPPDYVHYGD
jgi:hypothetical protein